MNRKQLAYKSEVIRHFYFGGTLSAVELSELSKKSLPLTTRIISELLEDKLLKETGLASSTGGRRPQTYALQTKSMFLVSVAMDQHTTRMAIMDLNNKCVGAIAEISLSLTNNAAALPQLGEALLHFLKEQQIPGGRLLGIGIGMPGFVDIYKGLNHSHLKPPAGHTIISFLEEVTQLPVFIDNDSSLIALAEFRFGIGKSIANLMVINISWGIGLGMILNGKMFRGDSGFAGEFSHIPIFSNGKMCNCGKLGCLETEASLLTMVDKAKEGINEGRLTVLSKMGMIQPEAAASAIMKAALDGDTFAVELITEIGYNIGRGVAILIHILNPGQIILSGRGAEAGKLWLAPIQQAINEHCIPKIAENTSIGVSVLGKNAELTGAAALVIENIDTGFEHILQKIDQKILS